MVFVVLTGHGVILPIAENLYCYYFPILHFIVEIEQYYKCLMDV